MAIIEINPFNSNLSYRKSKAVKMSIYTKRIVSQKFVTWFDI